MNSKYYKITGEIDSCTSQLVVEVTDTQVLERHVTNTEGKSWSVPREESREFYGGNTPKLFDLFVTKRKDLEITELSEDELFTIYL